MFKYNYVFFNITDDRIKKTKSGYNTICAMDLEDLENVELVSFPLDYAPAFVRWLFRKHHSKTIAKIVKLPFKNWWYPFYFRNRFQNKKPLCFVVSGVYLPVDYLRYLKRKYPDAKFVRIYRDLVELFFQRNPQYSQALFDEIFDLQMSFDEEEAKRYGMEAFSEFESKIPIKRDENYPLCDVFFAGTAKARLGKLMDIYHKLTAAGLKCHYYLFGVPQEKRVPYEGVEYGDHYLPYDEMLRRTVNARCVLEINQDGAVGYTSRFLEAVMYNKKLLTDNLFIKKSPFYREDYIQCIQSVDDIDVSFIQNETVIDYHYQDEFSPVHLLEQIDSTLQKRQSEVS